MSAIERELRAELARVTAALAAAVVRADALQNLVDGMTAAHQAALGADVPSHGDWSPPTVLPPFWVMRDEAPDGARYVNRAASLVVIVSASKELDGKRWLHLSMSHAKRVPKWRELREAKDIFIGPGRYAYQVLPSADHYVNLDPRVLHLWHCLDGDPLPDFTRGGNTI